MVEISEDGPFMRDRHVATHEPRRDEAFYKAGEPFRRHVDGLVASGKAEMFQPIAVQHRRARVSDRVADDKGGLWPFKQNEVLWA